MRRYEALREWRKQTAAERGVNPVVILATDEIKEISQGPHRDPDAEKWLACLSEHKREVYGPSILEVLSRPLPPKKHRRRRRKSGGKKAQKVANE